jgi:hypothetical protein
MVVSLQVSRSISSPACWTPVRVDADGLRLNRSEVERFAAERNFGALLEKSANQNLGCDELRETLQLRLFCELTPLAGEDSE